LLCVGKEIWGKKKKACFKVQLKALCNQLPASHCCLVGQEQKAAWGNAAGAPGPQPVRIFKILMKEVCTKMLHRTVALLSSYLPPAPLLGL